MHRYVVLALPVGVVVVGEERPDPCSHQTDEVGVAVPSVEYIGRSLSDGEVRAGESRTLSWHQPGQEIWHCERVDLVVGALRAPAHEH